MNQKDIYSDLDKLYQKDKDHWARDKADVSFVNEKIISLVKQLPHARILEVGCGKGTLTEELVKICDDVVAIDVSPTTIDYATSHVKGAKFKVCSLEDLEDNNFDIIICSEILCYIKKPSIVLDKLPRLGKYLILKHYLFIRFNIGLGNIKYELLLNKFKTLNRRLYFSPKRLYATLYTTKLLS